MFNFDTATNQVSLDTGSHGKPKEKREKDLQDGATGTQPRNKRYN